MVVLHVYTNNRRTFPLNSNDSRHALCAGGEGGGTNRAASLATVSMLLDRVSGPVARGRPSHVTWRGPEQKAPLGKGESRTRRTPTRVKHVTAVLSCLMYGQQYWGRLSHAEGSRDSVLVRASDS